MIPEKKLSIEEVCRVLELPIDSWTLEGNSGKEKAEKSLQDFKDLVKKQKRTLAKKYHPDKTGGDDTKIKEINSMIDLIMKLEITKIPQRVRPRNVRFHFSSNSPFHNSSGKETSDFFNGTVFYKHFR